MTGWSRLRARFGPRRRAPVSSGKQRSGATELFFRDPRGAPLIVVVHISKTAGTALRRVVRAALADAEAEVIHNLRYVARTPAERLEWFRTWYESLPADRRERLACVMSHWSGFLLPALDCDADALTLVREPVDRTLSYYFHKRRQHPEWSLASLELLARRRAETGWRKREDGKLLDRLFNNWQSRVLLSIFHDVSSLETSTEGSPEAELWRRRLHDLVERVFLVGVQDRFDEYVAFLARRYGWEPVAAPRAKVNPLRPADVAVSPDLRRAILTYNWLDRELHELAGRVQRERESAPAGAGSAAVSG